MELSTIPPVPGPVAARQISSAISSHRLPVQPDAPDHLPIAAPPGLCHEVGTPSTYPAEAPSSRGHWDNRHQRPRSAARPSWKRRAPLKCRTTRGAGSHRRSRFLLSWLWCSCRRRNCRCEASIGLAIRWKVRIRSSTFNVQRSTSIPPKQRMPWVGSG